MCSFETENGILAQEHGTVNKQTSNKEGTNGHGFYQYPGDDGKIYRVEYTVGEQGFIPNADHLPTALKRAFELHKKKRQNQQNQEKQQNPEKQQNQEKQPNQL